MLKENELIRTDSTTLTTLYYRKKNKIGTKITPMGRERGIERLNREFIKEFMNKCTL